MMDVRNYKSVIILIELVVIILLSLGWYNASHVTTPDSSVRKIDTIVSNNSNSDLNDFPPLNLPLDYFDAKDESFSTNLYHVFRDGRAYQSYPSTIITLDPNLYSNIPEPLPPIKSDVEIHGNDPLKDIFGYYKGKNIQQYGDLARRFVGVAGEGLTIDSVKYVNVQNKREKDTLISLSLTGANVLGTQDILISGDKIIFSSKLGSFSTLTPASNENGFFLKWCDNSKCQDGFVTTRFIFDGSKFVPIYEQKTRYIRVKQ